jgi:PAS domain S-box-containing protein
VNDSKPTRHAAESSSPRWASQAEAHFEALAQAIPALLLVLGPDLVPVYANRRWTEFYGSSPDEAHARQWRGYVHEEDLPEVAERWATSVPRGESFEGECRLIRHDGQVRWHLVRTAPVHGDAGQIVWWCATLTDIHESKEAERARRDSEERYRALFASIDEGFCVMQMLFDERDHCVDYRFLEMNEAFERHTGLHGALGKTARELVPDLDESWFRIYGGVALTGEPARFENAAPAMKRWFDVYAFRVGPPQDRRVALVFKDITEKRRNELALRESEERFRSLADNIAQLAWMSGPDGKPFWCNRRWYEYTGAEPGREESWGFVHEDHADRVWASYAASLRSGAAWEETFPMADKDGQHRWFLARAVPIRDRSGAVVRWLGTHTDITDHRRAQEALTAADRRKDEFLAVLAHELRNPLAPLRSAVDVLKLQASADPETTRASAVIDRQVKHMSRLIDDLLDVSRIARGQLQLRLEPCNLAALVRQTAEDYRANYERRGLELVVDTPEAAWIDGDPTRLSQMVGNLLHNAEKFTQRRGRVEVTMHAEDATRTVAVSVRDTGAGIEADMLDRLFEPFSQGDMSLDRSQGGLGLGLALVRSLALLHGGEVAAASSGPGLGANFTLRFPLMASAHQADSNQANSNQANSNQANSNQPDTRRPSPPASSAPGLQPGGASAREAAPTPTPATRPVSRTTRSLDGPSSPLRILIVEDNVDAAELLRTLLEMMGHRVELAHDGPQGVAAAKASRPDLVLSDIGLPGAVDGYALARAVRADPALASTVLVALSGYGQPEDRKRSSDAGFDEHLVKPAEYEALRDLMSRVALARS